MRTIYEKARQVQIWLGPSDENAKSAFATIQRLVDYMRQYEATGKPWASFMSQFMYEYGGPPNQWIYETRPFVGLLARQWFLRVWTLQEIVVGSLNKRAVLVCGDSRCWFDDLAYICATWRAAGMMPCVIHGRTPADKAIERRAKSAINQLAGVENMRHGVQGQNRINALNLLKAGRIREATDPRDKIFGLIGITSDCDDEYLKPDSSLDTRTVYKRYAVHKYRTTQDLELFSMCCLAESPYPELRSLPRWVPDWSNDVEHDQLGHNTRTYHAGTSHSHSLTCTETDGALRIKGVIIGRIAHLSIGITRGDSQGFPHLYANFAQVA